MEHHLQRAVDLIEAGRAESVGIMAYALISCAVALHRITETVHEERRDYFAAMALGSLLTLPEDVPSDEIAVAKTAYRYADAMMMARQANSNGLE